MAITPEKLVVGSTYAWKQFTAEELELMQASRPRPTIGQRIKRRILGAVDSYRWRLGNWIAGRDDRD